MDFYRFFKILNIIKKNQYILIWIWSILIWAQGSYPPPLKKINKQTFFWIYRFYALLIFVSICLKNIGLDLVCHALFMCTGKARINVKKKENGRREWSLGPDMIWVSIAIKILIHHYSFYLSDSGWGEAHWGLWRQCYTTELLGTGCLSNFDDKYLGIVDVEFPGKYFVLWIFHANLIRHSFITFKN